MSKLKAIETIKILRFFILLMFALGVTQCGLPDLGSDPTLSVSVPGDQMVNFGEEVNLEAFANHSSGGNVTLLWELISKPSESDITLQNANTNTISFKPDVLGEYVLRFTANSDDGLSAFEEVLLTVIKAPVVLTSIDSETVIANIYDDPADPDYIVKGNVTFSANVTIEEDVFVIFEENTGLSVSSSGSLKAIGTPDKPILFSGIQKTKGFWKGLNFESRSPLNELRFTTIEYGGSGGFDGANEKANITLNDGILKLSDVHSVNGEGMGLLTRAKEDLLPDFRNNVFSGNSSALHVNKTQFHFLDASSDYSGNNEDFVTSWGSNALIENVTWKALNVPYRLRPGRENIESDLIIEKGARFIGQDGSGLHIRDNGSVKAVGTSNEPIIFEGQENTAGYWLGIEIESNTDRNELRYVTIKDGGKGGFDGANLKANLILDQNARLKMTNCILSNSLDRGLIVRELNAVLSEFSDNRITANAIPVQCLVNHFHYFDGSSDLTGNAEDVIITTWANSPTAQNVTWKKMTVPYKITKTDFIGSDITIEPGAEFVFTDGSGLEVYKEGSLNAQGSLNDPIIFRGSEDVHGYWIGLKIFSKSDHNMLTYVNIQNGGSKDQSFGEKANLIIWRDARVTISSSSLSKSGGYGISVGKEGVLNAADITYVDNLAGEIFYE
ncbi:PKD domain-containing protein [Portibacter marinus]|uniref:PKD domain-containing protein n=1 Tax=Portibacter marinus TaxID=2898660 RepID=UPI001F3532FF|nr:hypothetical protein [Portibacter marinus]